MRISIITAVLNKKNTIKYTIESVLGQRYKDIEHIIIDGGSTDGTLDIINRYAGRVRIMSEYDSGIYDALNKGIVLSSGHIIGFLHSDDTYAHSNVLQLVADTVEKYNVDSCYGDLIYVGKNNANKIIRYWKSSAYRPGKFKDGWMPPHPTFFVKKGVYDAHGLFNTTLKIAADYELMLRFLEKNKISTSYIPQVLVHMRCGGISNYSLGDMMLKSIEDFRAWKINDLKIDSRTILQKNISKIPQFFKIKNRNMHL